MSSSGLSYKSKVLSTSRPTLGVSIITYNPWSQWPQSRFVTSGSTERSMLVHFTLEEKDRVPQKKGLDNNHGVTCIVFCMLIFLCILYILIDFLSQQLLWGKKLSLWKVE